MKEHSEATIALAEARRRIEAVLRLAGVPEGQIGDLGNQGLRCGDSTDLLSDDWPWDGLPRGAQGSFGNLGPDWTIKETELISVLDLVPLVATWLAGGPASSIFASALCMAIRLSRKGFKPSPCEGRVLVELRRAGSLTVEVLVARVSRASAGECGLQQVTTALEALSKKKLANGATEELVHFSDGKWSTSARGLWEVPFF